MLLALARRQVKLVRNDFAIVQHGRIVAVNDIAQEAEPAVQMAADGQELVGGAHFAHAYQVVEAHQAGASGKAYLAHAPHVVAHHQVSPHQLEALALGDEANAVLQFSAFALHYRINAICVILLSVGRQRRDEFIIKQCGGINIDIEIFGQAFIHAPKLSHGAHAGLHLLVVEIRGGEVQVTVRLHHVLPHAFAQAEHGGHKAQDVVFLPNVHIALDVQTGFIALHRFGIHGGKEDDLLHNAVRRARSGIRRHRIRTGKRHCPRHAEQRPQHRHYDSQSFHIRFIFLLSWGQI